MKIKKMLILTSNKDLFCSARDGDGDANKTTKVSQGAPKKTIGMLIGTRELLSTRNLRPRGVLEERTIRVALLFRECDESA